MSTCHYIICHDCKKIRDLDKAWLLAGKTPQNRKEMEEFAENVKEDNYRAALLLAFLLDHAAHRCEFTDEHNEELFDGRDHVYSRERNFWSF